MQFWRASRKCPVRHSLNEPDSHTRARTRPPHHQLDTLMAISRGWHRRDRRHRTPSRRHTAHLEDFPTRASQAAHTAQADQVLAHVHSQQWAAMRGVNHSIRHAQRARVDTTDHYPKARGERLHSPCSRSIQMVMHHHFLQVRHFNSKL